MNNLYTQDFIRNLFKAFQKSDLRYCVLRGYEGLPEIAGRDIDILIDIPSNKIAIREMKNTIQNLGWKTYLKTNQDGFFTLICYLIGNTNVSVIQLDFWTSLNWRGIKWCDTNYALNRRVLYKDFYVADKGGEAAIICLKELVAKKDIKEKYFTLIRKACTFDKESFQRTLKPLGKLAEKLCVFCENDEFDKANRLKNKVLRRLKNKHPFKYFSVSFGRLCRNIHSIFKPKGKLLVFLGPDGSGKTTLLNNLNPLLSPFFEGTKVFHMRYNILPELKTGHGFSSMKGQLIDDAVSSQKGKKGSKKKRRSLLSVLASWFVVLYYHFEFLLGNHISRKLKRKNRLILYDRYFYDHFIQPTSRDLIFPIRQLLMFPIKKPDIIIHLDADPEVVYKRKQELSKSEIERQNFYLNKLFENNKRAITINTSNKNEEEIKQVAFEMISKRIL